VDFDGPDDPYHPMNWPFRKKVVTTALYGYVVSRLSRFWVYLLQVGWHGSLGFIIISFIGRGVFANLR
jgi:hypothetical protein